MILAMLALYLGFASVAVVAVCIGSSMQILRRRTAAVIAAVLATTPPIAVACLVLVMTFVREDDPSTAVIVGNVLPGVGAAVFLLSVNRSSSASDIVGGVSIGLMAITGLVFILTSGLLYLWCVLPMIVSLALAEPRINQHASRVSHGV